MVMVRPATPPDAPAIGRLHVRAWQAAYRGHMPDAYLDGLRPTERADYWRGVPGRDDLPGAILVAERDGEVAGFAAERTSEVFGVTVPEVRYRRRSTSEAISSATPVGTE
jgi:hypothetical protein